MTSAGLAQALRSLPTSRVKARRSRRIAAVSAVAASLICSAAHADTSVIKRPGAHPRYSLEAEPHLALGYGHGPGPIDDGNGFGPGGRFTLELVDNGFISSINNTVGIGFGLDLIFWGDADYDECRGPDNARDCERHHDTFRELVLPVVMQWNFWVSRNWSVFGEPGVALRLRENARDRFEPFVFYAGGRYHFSDNLTLTMRIGYPSVSVGVSFLL